jgi:hypothetical protein
MIYFELVIVSDCPLVERYVPARNPAKSIAVMVPRTINTIFLRLLCIRVLGFVY